MLDEGTVAPSEPDLRGDAEAFYSEHGGAWDGTAWEFPRFAWTSTPSLWRFSQLLDRLKEVAPGPRVLDAGCGRTARDARYLKTLGMDPVAFDAFRDSVENARRFNPEMGRRILQADLLSPLPFPDAWFDAIVNIAVIQHLPPPKVRELVLPEFARVLSKGGTALVVFKTGEGLRTVHDGRLEVDRTFQLYEPGDILSWAASAGLDLVAPDGRRLGGVVAFDDGRGIDHAATYLRKKGQGEG